MLYAAIERGRGGETEIKLGAARGIVVERVYLRSFGRKIWGKTHANLPWKYRPVGPDLPQSFLARPFQPKKCQSKVKISLFFQHLIHKIKDLSWSDPVRTGLDVPQLSI